MTKHEEHIIEYPCACPCGNKIAFDLMPTGALNAWSDKGPAMMVTVTGRNGIIEDAIIQGPELLAMANSIQSMFAEPVDPQSTFYDVPVIDNPIIPQGYITVVEEQPNGDKNIVGVRLSDGTVMKLDEAGMIKDRPFGVGDRVRIIDRMPQEYAGKLGTITAMGEVRISAYPEAGVMSTPEITLDDGTVVYGFQLWWEKIGGPVE